MAGLQVEIAGKSYALTEPNLKQSRAWRAAVAAQVGDLSVIGRVLSQEINDGLDLADIASTLSVDGDIERLVSTAFNSPDVVLDIVCSFNPALENDKAALADNAKMSELLSALVSQVSLVYPFGVAVNQVIKMSNG